MVTAAPAEEDAASGSAAWNPWYGPLALAVGFIASIVTGVIIVVIGHSAGASLTNPPPAVLDLATFAEEVGFVLSAIWIASWVARPRPEQFGLRRVRVWWQAVAVVVGAYLTFIIISAIWAALLNSPSSEKKLVTDIGGHAGVIGVAAACLVTCVLAPICEEFLFRGFIFGALRNWRGPWIAAVITGVLFGAVHVGSAPAVDLVPLGLLGVILCLIRQWVGSLYPCIALHALNNSIALGLNESWGWQIVVLFVAALGLISLTLAFGLRVARVRFA
jgi:uncharacterized protein